MDIADQFHYANTVLSGDGSLIARVSSMDQGNAWNKCGIMIRESLDAGSGMRLLPLQAGMGLLSIPPKYDGASTNTNLTGFTAPFWLKLTKSASLYTAWYSIDSMNWKQLGDPVDLGFGNSTPFYCGFALTSHDNNVLSTATIDNFSSAGFTTVTIQSFTGEINAQQTVDLNWTLHLR